MAIIDLANPTRFLTLVNRVLPWLALATVAAFAYGLIGVIGAPDDYQQGATAKIMFIHVPSAWLSMGIWSIMSIAALGTLVWRHPLADVAAKTAAPIGAAFTLQCLITGSLWGRPMWGTYWVCGRCRQPADHQIFRRLVEHPAPTGVGTASRRALDSSDPACPAAGHGVRVWSVVPYFAPRRHAQRDHAAARPNAHDVAGRRGSRALIHGSWSVRSVHRRRLWGYASDHVHDNHMDLA